MMILNDKLDWQDSSILISSRLIHVKTLRGVFFLGNLKQKDN
jgi:hypothetical protein